MEYITAVSGMADAIYNILHTTIRTVYPEYYPKEVVDFFCHHHSKEHILDGIATGNMGVLSDGDVITGTGCFLITILQVYMCCHVTRDRAVALRLWTAWKRKLVKNMIKPSLMLLFQGFVYMSTEVIKQWDMGFMS